MGGNIQFKTPTRRYLREEYLALEKRVISALWSILYDSAVSTEECTNYIQSIKAYSAKESFGDMDLVVCSEKLHPQWRQRVIEEFWLEKGDWNANGGVFSFVYCEFQIDLIITPRDEFQTSLEYFAYNDLGNLVGRLAKRLGIKYGHAGSHIPIKADDYVLGNILVTKSTQELYELLVLDYATYEAGFETLEDIFEFVSTSKYFNPDIYLLENRNHVSRTRDAKRKTYHEFLEWCKTQTFSNVYSYDNVSERGGYNIREPYFSELIVPRYPHVKLEYDIIIEKHLENKAFAEKFNGIIVNRITGLQGKELGEFMRFCRDCIRSSDIRFMFIKYGQHTCDRMIASMYSHYINKWDWLNVPEELGVEFVRGGAND